MRKIFYSIATAVLVLATTTHASAHEIMPAAIPPVKHAAVAATDTCDQLYFYSIQDGKLTVRHACDSQASAVQMNFAYFKAGDTEITKLFNDETTIKLNDQHEADLIVTNQFYMENFSAIASR